MVEYLKIIFNSTVLVAFLSSLTTILTIFFTNKWKDNKSPSAGKALEKTVENAGDLYKIMWEILDQFGAKRCAIFEFHNGGKYYSGRPIQRVTMSHEVASYRLARISREFQGTVMSDAFHIGLKELLEMDSVYYSDVDNLPDNGTKSMIQYYKGKAVAGFLYKNKQGDPIACFVVCFDRIKPLSIPELEILEARSKEVENLLSKI